MHIPEGLKYTKEHEWVRVEGNIATIGITDHAQSELGDIVFVEVDTLDETIEKDEVFGSEEAVKTTSDLFMPVSGKVIEFNEKISEDGDDQPALINEDPYGEGWIIRVEMTQPDQFNELLAKEDYQSLIN